MARRSSWPRLRPRGRSDRLCRMSGQFFPEGASPQAAASPPPSGGSRWWVWLLAIGGLLLISPFCCCGGLLIFASSLKDFALSNGQHLGGPTMNVRFDYEIRNDQVMFSALL